MKSKSKTIIKKPATGWNVTRKPIAVGEVLVEEFLVPMGMTQAELAAAIKCDVKTINRICRGKTSLTANIAVRLAHYFENSPEFWMHFQICYDIWEVEKEIRDAS